ncbi:MAG: hypothetical protein KatS3mg014_2180 [Actinomycetota bacterium]|nr:MAG: hypothetical protein KatS3mg014_2180 [Actinomycetota bacterium]
MTQAVVPRATTCPSTLPSIPAAVLLVHVGREREGEAPLAGRAHDRRGEDVGRDLVQGGREPEHLVRIELAEGLDVGDLRRPRREGAGLVEQEHGAPGEGLEGPAALHDDPALRGPGDPRHDGDGDREDHRTGRRDHEHRERPHRIAGEPPRRARDRQGRGDEPQRVPVGEPHERRLLRLRLLHEADDARVRALGGGRAGPQVEGGTRVHRAAADLVPSLAHDRHGLARQGRLVQDARLRGEDPVHRHDLPGLHEQQVPGRHVLHRHVVEPAVPVPMGEARRALEERGELALGPTLREVLEGPAARQHQGQHRPRLVLAEGEGPDHREERDQVDARPTPAELLHRGPEQREHPRHRGRAERHVGGVVVAADPQRPAHRDPERRDREVQGVPVQRPRPRPRHRLAPTRPPTEVPRAGHPSGSTPRRYHARRPPPLVPWARHGARRPVQRHAPQVLRPPPPDRGPDRAVRRRRQPRVLPGHRGREALRGLPLRPPRPDPGRARPEARDAPDRPPGRRDPGGLDRGGRRADRGRLLGPAGRRAGPPGPLGRGPQPVRGAAPAARPGGAPGRRRRRPSPHARLPGLRGGAGAPGRGRAPRSPAVPHDHRDRWRRPARGGHLVRPSPPGRRGPAARGGPGPPMRRHDPGPRHGRPGLPHARRDPAVPGLRCAAARSASASTPR